MMLMIMMMVMMTILLTLEMSRYLNHEPGLVLMHLVQQLSTVELYCKSVNFDHPTSITSDIMHWSHLLFNSINLQWFDNFFRFLSFSFLLFGLIKNLFRPNNQEGFLFCQKPDQFSCCQLMEKRQKRPFNMLMDLGKFPHNSRERRCWPLQHLMTRERMNQHIAHEHEAIATARTKTRLQKQNKKTKKCTFYKFMHFVVAVVIVTCGTNHLSQAQSCILK